jgi:hypothetical protein
VEAKLGGPRKEIEFVQKLLIEVQEKGAAPAEQREVSFAVELIKR